jgi:hypothetical protein
VQRLRHRKNPIQRKQLRQKGSIPQKTGARFPFKATAREHPTGKSDVGKERDNGVMLEETTLPRDHLLATLKGG